MSRTILLADDSVTIRKVVELTFMEEDYQLFTAAGGQEALDMLEKTAPDLVIADVHMPDVGGFEVCRLAKQRHPSVPVLLLVGAFEPFDPSEAEACGADQFLKKPFDSQDLLRHVGKLIEDSQAAAEEEERAAEADEPEAAPTAAPDEATAAAATVGEAGVGAPGGTETQDVSDEMVDRIARKVVEMLSDDKVREVAWEVVPDLAETVIKERLRELEGQVE